jgi:hypothetical protein
MPFRLLIVLLLGSIPAAASPEDEYFAAVTYPESVQLALQKNFAIAGASYDPLVSRAKLRSSEGKFDPDSSPATFATLPTPISVASPLGA